MVLASSIPWDPVTIPLAAAGTTGDVREVPAFCDYIGIYDTTDDTAVQISFDNRTFFAANKGVYFRPAGGCDRAWFKNTSGAPISVTVGKGLGDIIDNRLVISAATKMGVFGPDAVGAAATQPPVAMGGVDLAGIIRRLALEPSGRMRGRTICTVTRGISTGAATNYFFALKPSATKNVELLRLEVATTALYNTQVNWTMGVQSSAIGGTTLSGIGFAHDGASAAPLASSLIGYNAADQTGAGFYTGIWKGSPNINQVVFQSPPGDRGIILPANSTKSIVFNSYCADVSVQHVFTAIFAEE